MAPPLRALRPPLVALLYVTLGACSGCGKGAPNVNRAPANADAAHAPMAIAAAQTATTPTGDAQPTAALTDAARTETGSSDATSLDAVAAQRCPSEMILVTGRYCPDLRHTCTQWMDPPGTYEHFRCARYGTPVCASPEKIALSFCIDRDEYTAPGDTLPLAHQSWSSARSTCESQGKRLCMESEWQFACEGEDMRPYPYGFERDATACNIDRMNLGKPNSGLRDLREPAGSHPRCVSPFGVRDMSGNVEEWATLDNPAPAVDGGPTDRSTMKGAWWLPGRNHCRAATTGHGEAYEGGQVGVRCCKDPG